LWILEEQKMPQSMQAHWNKVYSSKPITQLGWYEAQAAQSLKLIEHCALDKQDVILDIGSGTTTLINTLLEQGFQRVVALDISEIALEKARTGLGAKKAAQVQWIVDDITNPTKLFDLSEVGLWHDRAAFHFVTDEQQRQTYLSTLLRVLRPGGYVIIAAFAIGGASRCSGLDVRNYDTASLIQFFGSNFELIESMDYTYHMPSGDLRPYVYTLFQRK
jgi:EEF1A lysine methyltransferase 2